MSRRMLFAAGAVLMFLFPVVLATSAVDPAGDSDGTAAHDILSASVTDYPDSVLFIPTMAGNIVAPASNGEEFEILFTVVSRAAYDPSAQSQVGMAYRIWLVPPPEAPTYQLAHAALGDGDPSILLNPQPGSGRDTAIFQVKKVHLQTLEGVIVAPGDWVADVAIRYLVGGSVVDSVDVPDHLIEPLGGGLELYPIAATDTSVHSREGLTTELPTGTESAVRFIGLRDQVTAEWASEPLDRPFRLDTMAAYVWISSTTSTPVAAFNWIDVKVFEEAEGFRNLLGRRLEYRFGENTGVFVMPGAPQQVGFFLAADATSIRQGARIILSVTTEPPPVGNAYTEGPGIVVYYGSAVHATQLHLDGAFYDAPTEPIQDLTVDVSRPNLGDVRATWTTLEPATTRVRYGPEGGPLELIATGAAGTAHIAEMTGLAPGAIYEYVVESDTGSEVLESARHSFRVPHDLSGQANTVVAVVNSGINPYHERFGAPNHTAHPSTYLTDYPATVESIALTLGGSSFGDAAIRDASSWHAMEPATQYFFPGTRVVAAIDFAHHNPHARATDLTKTPDLWLNLDAANEGTAVAAAILNENPNVLFAIVKNGGTEGIRWAAQQPYIDVIDIGFWHTIFLDEGPRALADAVDLAHANGKIVTSASGDILPGYLADDMDGGQTGYAMPLPPANAIVTGSWSAVWTGEAAEGARVRDVVNLFVVGLTPLVHTVDEYYSTSGANRASGRTAGILSSLILELRRTRSDFVEGPHDGGLVSWTGGGAFGDGTLTNTEIRHFVNRTASTYGPTEWTPQVQCITTVFFCGADVPTTPAYWLQVGWGFASRASIPQIVRMAEGKLPVPEKPVAQDWMAAMYESRAAFYAAS